MTNYLNKYTFDRLKVKDIKSAVIIVTFGTLVKASKNIIVDELIKY